MITSNTKNIVSQFKEYTSQLMARIEKLSEKQLNLKPFEGSWSVAQVADHLYRSYNLADGLKVPGEKCTRDPEQFVPDIHSDFLDFTVKYESPSMLLPAEGFIKKEKLLADLNERLAKMEEALSTTDLEEICIVDHPGYGELTKYEWIDFMVCHTKRHLHQIEHIETYIN